MKLEANDALVIITTVSELVVALTAGIIVSKTPWGKAIEKEASTKQFRHKSSHRNS